MYTPVAKILFSYYLTRISRFLQRLEETLVMESLKLSYVRLYAPVALKFFSYYQSHFLCFLQWLEGRSLTFQNV